MMKYDVLEYLIRKGLGRTEFELARAVARNALGPTGETESHVVARTL